MARRLRKAPSASSSRPDQGRRQGVDGVFVFEVIVLLDPLFDEGVGGMGRAREAKEHAGRGRQREKNILLLQHNLI
jgi:hypothetical protein